MREPSARSGQDGSLALLYEADPVQGCSGFGVFERCYCCFLASALERYAVGRVHELELRAKELDFERGARFEPGIVQE